MSKWETVKLSDIYTLQMGKTPSRNNLEYWNGTNKWLSIADISKAGKYVSDTKETISDLAVSESGIKVTPKDTVVMSFKLSIGKTAITAEDIYTNEAIMSFIDRKKYDVDTGFIYHLFSAKDWSEGSNKAVKGITLNKATLSDIEIPLPPLEIQREIAYNLDKASEAIELCRKILEKLDYLVKAKFAEMFGENKFPVLRWNDVFETTTGKLDSNDMDENGLYPFFTCSKTPLRINTYAFDQEALLLAGNNAVGKYDVKHYSGKFNAYQRTYVLTLKNNWSYELFKCQLENQLDYLQNQSLGGLTKYLTLKILSELKFTIPPLPLQEQFAEYVKKIDLAKSAVKKTLEKAQTLKNALMQKYFG